MTDSKTTAPETAAPTVALVETMPECWRESHNAAGNAGVYPHNGAERRWMPIEEAEALVESDGEWTSIVRTGHTTIEITSLVTERDDIDGTFEGVWEDVPALVVAELRRRGLTVDEDEVERGLDTDSRRWTVFAITDDT